MTAKRSSTAIALFAATAIHLAPAAEIRVPADHPTIAAALAASTAGDQVIVAPGTYRERVEVPPGVTLRGDRAEQTVLDGGGEPGPPGVTLGAKATLARFTVTGMGAYDDERWNHHHATQGNEQHHEDIGPGISPAVVVGAGGAVTRCIVHHNGAAGIALSGDGNSLVTQNRCYRNMGAGISVTGSGKHQIRENTCEENFFAGIGTSGEDARPDIIRNTCTGNIRAGIGAAEGAQPRLLSNRCERNRRAGIGLRDGAVAEMDSNVCAENAMAGIGFDGAGRGNVVTGSRIVNNAMAGVGFRGEGGEATLQDNTISGNKLVAAGIGEGWTVTFKGNTLAREGGMPPLVMVFAGAVATFTDNELSGGGITAFRVAGKLTATGNTITSEDPATARRQVFWALEGAELETGDNTIRGWSPPGR